MRAAGELGVLTRGLDLLYSPINVNMTTADLPGFISEEDIPPMQERYSRYLEEFSVGAALHWVLVLMVCACLSCSTAL